MTNAGRARHWATRNRKCRALFAVRSISSAILFCRERDSPVSPSKTFVNFRKIRVTDETNFGFSALIRWAFSLKWIGLGELIADCAFFLTAVNIYGKFRLFHTYNKCQCVRQCVIRCGHSSCFSFHEPKITPMLKKIIMKSRCVWY